MYASTMKRKVVWTAPQCTRRMQALRPAQSGDKMTKLHKFAIYAAVRKCTLLQRSQRLIFGKKTLTNFQTWTYANCPNTHAICHKTHAICHKTDWHYVVLDWHYVVLDWHYVALDWHYVVLDWHHAVASINVVLNYITCEGRGETCDRFVHGHDTAYHTAK